MSGCNCLSIVIGRHEPSCPMREPDPVPGDVEVLRAACELVVREMERYYRDGSHPDLSPILRACREALEETA